VARPRRTPADRSGTTVTDAESMMETAAADARTRVTQNGEGRLWDSRARGTGCLWWWARSVSRTSAGSSVDFRDCGAGNVRGILQFLGGPATLWGGRRAVARRESVSEGFGGKGV